MRSSPTPIAIALLTLPLPPARSADAPAAAAPAASAANERARLDSIAAEVKRRRALREAALLDASRLVEKHDSGKKPATAAELEAAREVIRPADSRKANQKISGATDIADLSLPHADMSTVAKAWEFLFKERVTVAERVATKAVTISIGKLPLPELREKFEAELHRQGVYLVVRPEGKFFDSEPTVTRTP